MLAQVSTLLHKSNIEQSMKQLHNPLTVIIIILSFTETVVLMPEIGIKIPPYI